MDKMEKKILVHFYFFVIYICRPVDQQGQSGLRHRILVILYIEKKSDQA